LLAAGWNNCARAVGAAMPRLENLYARLKELTPRRP
jgi:hypothetical protein